MGGRGKKNIYINLTNKFYPAGVFASYSSQKNAFDEFECEIFMAKYVRAETAENCNATEQTQATVMSLSMVNHSSCVYSLLVNRYCCGSHCRIPERCFHAAAHHFFLTSRSYSGC